MAKLVINADIVKGKINKEIYGHFSEHLGRCIYEGIWVGEDSPIPNTRGMRNDVIEALKKMKVPVLRWPGGCFADEYHWKDGIGPKENRKKMVNTNWGGVVEDNSFGTHEFLDFCELIGAEPYINGNLGSGTVQEMQEWVEYMTFDGESPMSNLRKANGREEPWKIKYFAVGNENWGCGGSMLPEYYADEYRRYSTFVKNYGKNKIYKIACGPNSGDYHWMEVLMQKAARNMNGISLHYYTTGNNWENKGSATVFEEKDWFKTMKNALVMEEFVDKHSTIMDKYDPDKKIGLLFDEWGTWFEVEPGTNPGFLYQQNTLRDACVAAMGLNIFNNHSDRVKMANIAQLVNVLQAPILTEGEKMILTPTYHVFEMYNVHQDAQLLDTHLTNEDYEYEGQKLPKINSSVSKDENGRIHISLCNIAHNDTAEVECELRGVNVSKVSVKRLTSDKMNAHNTFDAPENIKPENLGNFEIKDNKFTVKMPAMSVAVLTLE